MEPLSKGEKMVDWVMKHIMPWFIMVMFIVCIGALVMGVISSV